jgi:hypothetical protein
MVEQEPVRARSRGMLGITHTKEGLDDKAMVWLEGLFVRLGEALGEFFFLLGVGSL